MSWGYLSHLHDLYIFGCESAVTWERLTREASAIGLEEPEEFPIGPILQGLSFAYIINISLRRCLHLFVSPSPDVLYVNGQLRQLADDDDGAVRCFPYRGGFNMRRCGGCEKGTKNRHSGGFCLIPPSLLLLALTQCQCHLITRGNWHRDKREYVFVMAAGVK